jgi:hypothetical protein
MSNDIQGLRDIMFATLRGIKDGSVEIDKAKAMNDMAQTIINSAKAEIEFIKVTGQTAAATSFLAGEDSNKQITNTPTGTKVTEKDPATGITSHVHRIRG